MNNKWCCRELMILGNTVMVVYQRNTSSPPESQVIAAQSIKRTRASLIAAPPPFDKLRSTTKKCAPLVYPCRRDWTAASHLESSQFPNHMQGPPLPAIIRVMAAKKPRKVPLPTLHSNLPTYQQFKSSSRFCLPATAEGLCDRKPQLSLCLLFTSG